MNLVTRSLLVLVTLGLMVMPATLSAAQDDNADPLKGTRWQLVYMNANAMRLPIDPSYVTLMFDEEGRAGGSGGCNSYGTTYAVDGDRITFENAFSTMMACDERTMMIEARYFEGLSTATRYEIIDGQLRIIVGDEHELVFEPLASITDAEWQLISYGDPQAPTLTTGYLIPTLLLNESEGRVSGSAGCNYYNGGYTLADDALTLTDIAATEIGCMDNKVMAQERAFLDALALVTRYEIIEGQLILYYGEGQQLVFEAVITVIGTQWQLEAFVSGDSASSLVADSVITLEFGADGNAGGRACNTYRTDYTMEDTSITFGPIVSTRMACQQDIMAQETAYLRALETASTYELIGDQLVITHAEGQLVFKPAAKSGDMQ